MQRALDIGLQTAKQAASLDSAGRLREAADKYKESVQWLERACVEEKDVKLVQTIRQYMQQYINRFNQIAAQTSTQPLRQSFTMDQNQNSQNRNSFQGQQNQTGSTYPNLSQQQNNQQQNQQQNRGSFSGPPLPARGPQTAQNMPQQPLPKQKQPSQGPQQHSKECEIPEFDSSLFTGISFPVQSRGSFQQSDLKNSQTISGPQLANSQRVSNLPSSGDSEKWKQKEIEFQQQIENLRQEVSKLMREKNDLEGQRSQQVMQKSQIVDSLQKQLAAVEEDLRISRETNDNHHRQFQKMKEGADEEKLKLRSEHEERVQLLQKELQVAENKNKELATELEDTSYRLQQLTSEKQKGLESLERITNSYLEKESHLSQELKELRDKLQKENQSLENLQETERQMFKTEKSQLEGSIQTLNMQADLLKKENESIKEDRQRLAQELAGSKEVIKKLELRAQTLEAELQEAINAKKQLSQSMELQAKHQRSENKEQLSQQEHKLQNLERELNNHKSIMAQQMQDLRNQLQNKERELLRTKQSYSLQVDTLQKRVQQLEESLEDPPLPPPIPDSVGRQSLLQSLSDVLPLPNQIQDVSSVDPQLNDPVPSIDQITLRPQKFSPQQSTQNQTQQSPTQNQTLNTTQQSSTQNQTLNTTQQSSTQNQTLNTTQQSSTQNQTLNTTQQSSAQNHTLNHNPVNTKTSEIDLTPHLKGSEGDPELLSGFLKKEGEGWFGAKRERFFTQDWLERKRLHYFEDKDSKAPLGTILLSGISAIKPLGNDAFELVTPHRTYKLQLSNREPQRSLQYWIHGLSVWVKRLHETAQIDPALLKSKVAAKTDAWTKTPPPLPPTASLSQLQKKCDEYQKQEVALKKLIDFYYQSHDLTGASSSERQLELLKKQIKQIELRISAFHASGNSVPQLRQSAAKPPSDLQQPDLVLEDAPPPPLPRPDEVEEDHLRQSQSSLPDSAPSLGQAEGANPEHSTAAQNFVWYMYENEEGIPYYYNTETEETTWDPPSVPQEEIGHIL